MVEIKTKQGGLQVYLSIEDGQIPHAIKRVVLPILLADHKLSGVDILISFWPILVAFCLLCDKNKLTHFDM